MGLRGCVAERENGGGSVERNGDGAARAGERNEEAMWRVCVSWPFQKQLMRAVALRRYDARPHTLRRKKCIVLGQLLRRD